MKLEIDNKKLKQVLSEGSHYSELIREIVYSFLQLNGRSGINSYSTQILVQSGVLKIAKEESDGKE